MQSSGGVMTLKAASRQPVRIIESGPAGGVAGALWLCSLLGETNAIAFDMGGTTAKACLIENGRVKVTTDYYIDGRIAGHPVQVPFLDIIEIGTGGGSIARVDSVGALKIGPQSAGAEPGPACYGLGGVEATVTDANLVAGKIDPDRFLGGEMKLNPALGLKAIRHLGDQLSLAPRATANGILRIANAMMAAALSKVTVERGFDPRDFVMVAYGGAGPMHATAVARELGVRRLIIPQAPGQFSALGMLTTDFRYDYAQTHHLETATVGAEALDAEFRVLEVDALADLAEDVGSTDVQFVRSVDMRYVGQFHTLTVVVPDEQHDDRSLDHLADRFHEAHEARYGHAARDEPTQIINLRLAAIIHLSKPAFRKIAAGSDEPPEGARLENRRVMWEDGIESESVIFQRERLLAGNRIAGPAIVQESASVIPIGRGETARVDDFGNLHISLDGGI